MTDKGWGTCIYTPPEKMYDARGTKNGNSKYTEDQIKLIKELLTIGRLSCPRIAEISGVGLATVHKLSAGRSWYHV